MGPNKNSGLLLMGGLGFLQHRIRIENLDNRVPNLNDDYVKGYDRLSNGFAAHQFIGYMHLSNSRRLNFYVGFELNQAWTQNRRGYNFDKQQVDKEKRLDLLYGIKVGWILPLYPKGAQKYFYY